MWIACAQITVSNKVILRRLDHKEHHRLLKKLKIINQTLRVKLEWANLIKTLLKVIKAHRLIFNLSKLIKIKRFFKEKWKVQLEILV